jgi:hypothetical protein
VATRANLTDQWQREMRNRFSKEFTVFNRATLDALCGESAWEVRLQCVIFVYLAKQDDVLETRICSTHSATSTLLLYGMDGDLLGPDRRLTLVADLATASMAFVDPNRI